MEPGPPPIPRRLPGWAWLLCILLLPSGLFIAGGFARLLTWRRGICLAILSFASCNAGFSMLMSWLEETHAPALTVQTGLTAGLLVCGAWIHYFYRIGKAAGYWSPAMLRGWRRAGWLGAGLCCLGCFSLLLLRVLEIISREHR